MCEQTEKSEYSSRIWNWICKQTYECDTMPWRQHRYSIRWRHRHALNHYTAANRADSLLPDRTLVVAFEQNIQWKMKHNFNERISKAYLCKFLCQIWIVLPRHQTSILKQIETMLTKNTFDFLSILSTFVLRSWTSEYAPCWSWPEPLNSSPTIINRNNYSTSKFRIDAQ